jgi:hypothetical protein
MNAKILSNVALFVSAALLTLPLAMGVFASLTLPDGGLKAFFGAGVSLLMVPACEWLIDTSAKGMRFSNRKIGGIRFVRLGSLCFSYCISKNK